MPSHIGVYTKDAVQHLIEACGLKEVRFVKLLNMMEEGNIIDLEVMKFLFKTKDLSTQLSLFMKDKVLDHRFLDDLITILNDKDRTTQKEPLCSLMRARYKAKKSFNYKIPYDQQDVVHLRHVLL